MHIIYLLWGCQTEKLPEATPPPVQLRLLNRREYTNTVNDLLMHNSQESCSTHTDCDVSFESCIAEQCVTDRCATKTLLYESSSSDSVQVVGTFNDWGTPNPWELSHQGNGLHVLKVDLPSNDYEYRFIVNGNEVMDPQNPNVSDDNHSLLTVECMPGGEYDFDPSYNFPVESRPDGFVFDNSAQKGTVTSTHIDKYIEAAYQISESVDPVELTSCDTMDDTCISSWLEDFGTRAFRRPLTSSEQQHYQNIYQGSPSSAQGVRDVLITLLVSPHFLYKKEVGSVNEDGSYQLNDYEIATALSYFIWGSTPDEALLSAAASGSLRTAEGREDQALRMLDNHRARRHFSQFVSQWLGTTDLRSLDKNPFTYYNFTEYSSIAIDLEQRAFVSNIIFEGSGRYDDLFVSDQTFLNEHTASLYNINDIFGPELQPVTLPVYRAAGLLSQGSFLAKHAHSDQSSPIKRGVAIRERILCQDLPDPPPNAGMAPEVDFATTTQQRFAQHTSDPNCFSCHQYIDGIGLAMERFDGIGQYREEENGIAINPSGDVVDVENLGEGISNTFVTLPQLANILVESERGAACFVRQMYRFSFGGIEEGEEEYAIETFVENFESHDRDIQHLITEIVKSNSFVLREQR